MSPRDAFIKLILNYAFEWLLVKLFALAPLFADKPLFIFFVNDPISTFPTYQFFQGFNVFSLWFINCMCGMLLRTTRHLNSRKISHYRP